MARPHIVIVGAGFGGLAAAHRLAGADADVTVIDRRNYHLFQPLLYQVATAGLSPAQIASPIRAILRRATNVQVVLGKVAAIDKARRIVTVEDRTLSYDHLVLATGARHSYFGRDVWEEAAPGLKKIDDATGIRRRILTAFEHAEGRQGLARGMAQQRREGREQARACLDQHDACIAGVDVAEIVA
jgi:NADH:ubiquinone reductase (H+-translocating)